MTEPELRDLIRRAQARDADAYDVLVDHYGPRLFGFLFRLSGSRSDAEDLLQELFLRVVRQLERYQHEGQFEAWLFRIATNLVRDHIRRAKRRPEHVSIREGDEPSERPVGPALVSDARECDPGEMAETQEQADRLQDALGLLSEAEREVVMLRHFSQLSFAEIAAGMGTPIGTALARAHRGLLKLRAIMEPKP